jgi:hypothetical protein
MVTLIGVGIGIVLILLALQLFGDVFEEDEFIPNMPFNLNDFPVFDELTNNSARGAGRRKRHASNTIMSDLVALGLGVAAFAYLYSRRQPFLFIWTVIGYLLAYNSIFKTSRVLSVLTGVLLTFVILMHGRMFEMFENEKKEEEPQATGKASHVDLGSTILHAYRNLSPEQIGGMKRDTKELMELQKELMGTLAEMKPAIEQGAQLLGTFSQFFGKDAQPAHA